jgi:hypothetical protein
MKQVDELQKILNRYLNWNKARLTCFCQIVLALFMVRSVNLTQIATAFQGKANTESHYKRLQRFFREFAFDMSCVFEIILNMFAIEGKVWLIIDRTNWQLGKKDINILTFAVGYKGIAIPLAWFVMNKAGNSFTNDRIKLLEKAILMMGKSKIKGLLADREFIGSEWFDYLIKNQIPFYIRIKEDTLAKGARDGYAVPLKDIFRHVKEGKKKILSYPLEILGNSFYVAASRLKNELLIVITNKNLRKALQFYKIRWEIETLFACLKTRGFCFESTHLSHPARIEKLIFVLCIAFCWSYRVGDLANTIKPIKIKKHGRKAKSLFRYGLDKIRETLFDLHKRFRDFLYLLKIFDHIASSNIPKRLFI